MAKKINDRWIGQCKNCEAIIEGHASLVEADKVGELNGGMFICCPECEETEGTHLLMYPELSTEGKLLKLRTPRDDDYDHDVEELRDDDPSDDEEEKESEND